MAVMEGKKWEYKYISEPAITVQKLLNQWKHQYRIAIIATEFDVSPDKVKYINILLAREEY